MKNKILRQKLAHMENDGLKLLQKIRQLKGEIERDYTQSLKGAGE